MVRVVVRMVADEGRGRIDKPRHKLRELVHVLLYQLEQRLVPVVCTSGCARAAESQPEPRGWWG